MTKDKDSYVTLELEDDAASASSQSNRTVVTPSTYSTLPQKSDASSLQTALKSLHAQVGKDPCDIDAWLQLVDIQEKMWGDADFLRNSSHYASLARTKLAVLERAFQASDRNKEALELRTAELRIAADSGVWSFDKLDQTWRTLLCRSVSTPSEKAGLWQEYLSFRASDASRFHVDDMAALYAEALHDLTSTTYTSTSEYSERDLDEARIQLVTSLCVCLRSAGMFTLY